MELPKDIKRKLKPNVKFGNVSTLFGREVASECLNSESPFLGGMDSSEFAS